MQFWDLDLDEAKGIDHAVVRRNAPEGSPLRPLRARLVENSTDGRSMRVFDPDGRFYDLRLISEMRQFRYLGRWNDRALSFRDLDMTWQGLAAQAYGEVLRQRDLVVRLARVGIVRSPEPYIIDADSPNAIERSVILNYDELDMLLRAANA